MPADVALSEDAPTAVSQGRHELRQGWRLILAGLLGIGVGIMALPFSTAGLFVGPLQAEFGWSRAAISLGPTILVVLVALLSPVVGWLADRMSEMAIVATSLLAVAGGFLALSLMNGDLPIYYGILVATALVGAGASTLVFARMLSAGFDLARGRALGLAMAGNGFTSILTPLLIGPFIAENGWRAGYQMLAVVLVIATVCVVLLLRNRPVLAATARAASGGLTFAEALKTRTFWLMNVAFLLATLASTGMIIHLVPLLTDTGLTPTRAAAFASLIGVGLITGRVLTGFLMDRFFAPWVGAVMLLASACGLTILAYGGEAGAPFGAFCIGLCVGAELDVVGYLTARYFGLKSYGRVYGVLYATILVGTGLSPLAYGLAGDGPGYPAGLTVGALLLVIGAGLLLLLPRFRTGEPA